MQCAFSYNFYNFHLMDDKTGEKYYTLKKPYQEPNIIEA